MKIRKDFLTLTSPSDFSDILRRHVMATGKERIMTADALHRVPADDIPSPTDLPDFVRSTVDGFAVKSADTHGASGAIPTYLVIIEDVPVGSMPQKIIRPGESASVVTGGAVPEGADAVVMVEHTNQIDERTVEISRGVSFHENIILPGEDMKRGDIVTYRGRRLNPYDVGALMGVGITEIVVFKKPRVALFSTGDEVVEPCQSPPPGKVRDINKYALSSAVIDSGGIPVRLDNVSDSPVAIEGAISRGIDESDVIILSGGSSVGGMDFTLSSINNLGSPGVIVHGISIKPGKPTIFGVIRDTPIFGLPGHPVGALVVFMVFVSPFIRMIGGEANPSPFETKIQAKITRNIPGSPGKDSFFPVCLSQNEGGCESEIPLATPVFGKSGLISILTRSNGLIRIPAMKEGINEGEVVTVFMYR